MAGYASTVDCGLRLFERLRFLFKISSDMPMENTMRLIEIGVMKLERET